MFGSHLVNKDIYGKSPFSIGISIRTSVSENEDLVALRKASQKHSLSLTWVETLVPCGTCLSPTNDITDDHLQLTEIDGGFRSILTRIGQVDIQIGYHFLFLCGRNYCTVDELVQQSTTRWPLTVATAQKVSKYLRASEYPCQSQHANLLKPCWAQKAVTVSQRHKRRVDRSIVD